MTKTMLDELTPDPLETARDEADAMRRSQMRELDRLIWQEWRNSDPNHVNAAFTSREEVEDALRRLQKRGEVGDVHAILTNPDPSVRHRLYSMVREEVGEFLHRKPRLTGLAKDIADFQADHLAKWRRGEE